MLNSLVKTYLTGTISYLTTFGDDKTNEPYNEESATEHEGEEEEGEIMPT